MKKKCDILAPFTMILMAITSITGILSLNFSYAREFVNQYGHNVKLYNYGIYASDSFFKAPISIGTDFCILFVAIPMFLYLYTKYVKNGDALSELKLISMYAVVFYYAASIAFGVTYNRLFLVYVMLFSASLFGMFWHITKLEWKHSVELTNGLKVFLILSGIALIVAWLPDIIPTLFTGDTLPLIGVYTTEITYVLDMGIISPLCFACLFLLAKKKPLGTVLLAVLLRACIIVGVMMIPQTVCQIASGIEIAAPVLITKSLSFVLLGGFAIYFNHKMCKEVV